MNTVPPRPSDQAPASCPDGSSEQAIAPVRAWGHVVEGRRAVILSLFAIAILSVPVFLARFPNDMDYYTLVADKLLHGGRLYRDALDTKPPLVFLHYALIFTVFGRHNIVAVKLVTMIFLGVSALAMRGLRRELSPSSGRPELAALLFVLASFSGWGEEFLSSNTELLSNLFVLLAAWCMTRENFRHSPVRLVVAGLLAGIACLYRYQAGVVLLAYVASIALTPRESQRLIQRFVCLAAGALIPLGVLVGYYAWRGGLQDLRLLLQYQSYYLRPHDVYWPQALVQVAIAAASLAPYLLLAGTQVVSLLRRRPLTRREIFQLLFLTGSIWPFFLGAHYYPHYLVQAIPALVLLATEQIVAPGRESNARRPFFIRKAPVLVLASVLFFSILNCVFYGFLFDPPPVPAVTRFVQQRTDANDSVFLWTPRFQVLLAIERDYATRFLSNEFLTGRLFVTPQRQTGATADSARELAVPELWPLLMHDLEIERPRVIIDDAPGRSNFTLDHYPLLLALVRQHYAPGQEMDGLSVYVRRSD